MKIGLASDHRGYKLKEKIKKYLKKKNIEFVDFGTNSSVKVDYNDYAILVCDAINNKEIDYGFLICGTGIGMSIAANKVKGIMCAKVDNAREARLAKEHNNANVLSFSSDLLYFEAKDIIDSYIKSKFLNTESYNRRIEKINALENSKSNKMEKKNLRKKENK